jgi:hypothetical protein
MSYCSICGVEYQLGVDRCSRCGHLLPQAPLINRETGQETSTDIRVRRAIAGIVDVGLAVAVGALIFRVLSARFLVRTRLLGALLAFAAAFIPAGYMLLRDSLAGKSVGKLLVGLTVVNLKRRQRAGLRDSFMRNLVFGFAAVPIVGWVVTAAIILIAAWAVVSGRPTRIGEGLSDARVLDDETSESHL